MHELLRSRGFVRRADYVAPLDESGDVAEQAAEKEKLKAEASTTTDRKLENVESEVREPALEHTRINDERDVCCVLFP